MQAFTFRYYFCSMLSKETPLTPSEAWKHFWENVKPTIWTDLDNKQKNRLITAERDSRGLRKDNRSGKALNLGPDRIEKLLTEFADGHYRIEKHIVFYVKQ